MRRNSALACLIMMLICATAQANNRHEQYNQGQASQGGNTDVVVDLPPEAWTQGQNRQPNCLKCCIFDNRNYTEGAVVKSEGVLLQCARDEQSIGTNNLIWKIIK